MSLHPEVVQKAHAELDEVVGPDRLPDFSDRGSLVYVSAIIKEILRWNNSTPLGLPHCTTEDDELHGYFIPAGTVLFANTWCDGFSGSRSLLHANIRLCVSKGLHARSGSVPRAQGFPP